MYVPITCKNEDSNKNKVLEWPQHTSHCRSKGIFPDAQGQLTPQSVVGSVRNSNSVETLRLSSLPARMKKIRSKMKELEWPQGFMSIFQTSNVR